MFGVKFTLNLKLGRLLLNYNFHNFPLRKDYQIAGEKILSYNLEKSALIEKSFRLADTFFKFVTCFIFICVICSFNSLETIFSAGIINDLPVGVSD